MDSRLSRSNLVSNHSVKLPDMFFTARNQPPRRLILPKVVNREAQHAYDNDENLPSNRACGRRQIFDTFGPSGSILANEMSSHVREPEEYVDHQKERMKFLLAGRYHPDEDVTAPRVHPSVKFNIEEWMEWGKCGAHPDFPDYPPLLQFNETFHPDMDNWKCRICDLVCPSPIYGCEKGHRLCFSCASVQLGSICPIWPRFDEEGYLVCCKRILTPLSKVLPGYLLHSRNTVYPCPFQKLGCVEKDLLPAAVVEHAQKNCKFRYTLRCFDDKCTGSKRDIRVGSFLQHLQIFHAPRVVNLEEFRSKNDPFCIEYSRISHRTPSSFSIPIVFDGNSGFELSMVMKRVNKFVYFWVYRVIDKGHLEPTPIQAELCLRNKTNDNEHLIVNNVIHHSTVSNQEVIQSGRCIQLALQNMDQFLFSIFPYSKSVTQKQTPTHEEVTFFLMKVSFTEKQESVCEGVVGNPSM